MPSRCIMEQLPQVSHLLPFIDLKHSPPKSGQECILCIHGKNSQRAQDMCGAHVSLALSSLFIASFEFRFTPIYRSALSPPFA
jgi:hypothetical protein